MLSDAQPLGSIDKRGSTTLRWARDVGDEDAEQAHIDVLRAGKLVGVIALHNLSAGLDVTWNVTGDRFALTWSDGGAIGGFHVRIFSVTGTRLVELTSSIRHAVESFRSRHFCKTRGNNVSALEWSGNNLLLMTDVYPTGDCGSDLGHTEGYLVAVPGGKIISHLTLAQLQVFPGVCMVDEQD